MSNPLDDALRKYDSDAERMQVEKSRQIREQATEARPLASLVNDFVHRMNKAGNPGITYRGRTGLTWVKGWGLEHWASTESNARQGVVVLTDGRIGEQVAGRHQWISPESSSGNIDVNHLALSMAELMRRHGVR